MKRAKSHPLDRAGRNDAGGICIRCGQYVRRGHGFVRRATPEEQAAWSGGCRFGTGQPVKWVTEHLECRARWGRTLKHYNHPEADHGHDPDQRVDERSA